MGFKKGLIKYFVNFQYKEDSRNFMTLDDSSFF